MAARGTRVGLAVVRGRSIASFIPNGRYHGLPDANHFIQEDAPDELGRIGLGFGRRSPFGHDAGEIVEGEGGHG